MDTGGASGPLRQHTSNASEIHYFESSKGNRVRARADIQTGQSHRHGRAKGVLCVMRMSGFTLGVCLLCSPATPVIDSDSSVASYSGLCMY